MICFYCISAQLGGAERSLLELLEAFSRDPNHGYEVWVLLPIDKGPLIDRLREIGVEVRVLKMPRSMLLVSRGAPIKSLINGLKSLVATLVYFARLRSLLKNRHPDILHTTGIKCHILGAIAGKTLGIPVLWHLRDILAPGPVRYMLRRLASICGVHLVSNSQASAKALDLPLLPQRLNQVIYNGLPPDRYASRPHSDLKREFNVPVDAPLIGILGVLARWKGQLEFIRMARLLLEDGSNARFIIGGGRIYDTAGDLKYESLLHEEVRAQGLEDRIFFAGFRQDAVKFLNGIDLLVHASIQPEPFGRVVLEAMACQVPVVATRGGGIEEFVEDERTGIIVEPGDVAGMAGAVFRILSQPELKDQLTNCAWQAFHRSFTVKRHLDDLLQIYDEILPEHRRVAADPDHGPTAQPHSDA